MNSSGTEECLRRILWGLGVLGLRGRRDLGPLMLDHGLLLAVLVREDELGGLVVLEPADLGLLLLVLTGCRFPGPLPSELGFVLGQLKHVLGMGLGIEVKLDELLLHDRDHRLLLLLIGNRNGCNLSHDERLV